MAKKNQPATPTVTQSLESISLNLHQRRCLHVDGDGMTDQVYLDLEQDEDDPCVVELNLRGSYFTHANTLTAGGVTFPLGSADALRELAALLLATAAEAEARGMFDALRAKGAWNCPTRRGSRRI